MKNFNLFLLSIFLIGNLSVYPQEILDKLLVTLNRSDPYNTNINYKSGADFQDLKRGVVYFVIDSDYNHHEVKKDWNLATANLMTSTDNNGEAYFLTAAHNFQWVFDYDNQELVNNNLYQVYLSFDYEHPHALKRPSKNKGYNFITALYPVDIEVLVFDKYHDIALFKLLGSNEDLLKYSYSNGWNNIPSSRTSTLIGHPLGDKKKIFNNPYSSSLEYISGNISRPVFDLPPYPGARPILAFPEQGYYNIAEGSFENTDGDTQSGMSGSSFFDENNLAISVGKGSLDRFLIRKGMKGNLLSNSWYGEQGTTNNLMTYLDPYSTYLKQKPGMYFNDALPVQPEDLQLTIAPGETLTNDISLTLSHLFNLTEPLVWQSIQGVNADDSTNLVLTVHAVYKDFYGIEYPILIYGSQGNGTSVTNSVANGLGFLGDGWDCSSPGGFPNCDSGSFFGSFESQLSNSTLFSKNKNLEYLFEEAQVSGKVTTIRSKDFKPITIRVRLENRGSTTAKVKAIGFPGHVPLNALQLFKPDEVFQKFKSYKYPKSTLQGGKFYINQFTISDADDKDNYSIAPKIGNTGNNGRYLNLVNDLFESQSNALLTSDDETRQYKVKLNIRSAVSTTVSLSVWIDFFNIDALDGKNSTNYTYNFVSDPVPHPLEKIIEQTQIQLNGGTNDFEYTF